jgi:hypothetical protein
MGNGQALMVNGECVNREWAISKKNRGAVKLMNRNVADFTCFDIKSRTKSCTWEAPFN